MRYDYEFTPIGKLLSDIDQEIEAEKKASRLIQEQREHTQRFVRWGR